jgi:hypothetical protein
MEQLLHSDDLPKILPIGEYHPHTQIDQSTD